MNLQKQHDARPGVFLLTLFFILPSLSFAKDGDIELRKNPQPKQERSISYIPLTAFADGKQIRLEFDCEASGVEISILDANGATVITESASAILLHTISIEELEAGNYTLEISLNGEEYSGEFIIK